MATAISRGYNYEITSTGITLDVGGSKATWTLPSLISTLNDGDPHFLVADFEWVSGTTWRLRTSVDGGAFSDQGTQSGPDIASADTDPSISLSDAASDAYADEVAMWAGHTRFTSNELSRLHALADTHGESLDQYTEQYSRTIGVSSDPSGASVTVSPNDDNGDGDGTAPFSRVYADDTDVTLTAPAKSGSRRFLEWRDSSGNTLSSSRALTVTVTAADTYTAHYEFAGDSADDYVVASP